MPTWHHIASVTVKASNTTGTAGDPSCVDPANAIYQKDRNQSLINAYSATANANMANDSVAVTAANNGGGLAVHHMQAHECVN
jgi:hypothetical protein